MSFLEKNYSNLSGYFENSGKMASLLDTIFLKILVVFLGIEGVEGH